VFDFDYINFDEEIENTVGFHFHHLTARTYPAGGRKQFLIKKSESIKIKKKKI
jgi:hypothetical protein